MISAGSSVKPSRLGLSHERVGGAGLPVDQGAVNVEGDKSDLFGNGHGAAMMPFFGF